MSISVAIVAQGDMGAAVGGALVRSGARVLTSLAGRSAASKERAQRFGIENVEDDDQLVASCDFFLSILPPERAVSLAERFAGPLARAASKPVYVDCNALAPQTVTEIGAILAPSGCKFVDSGILGGPPAPGRKGPVFYASGEPAADFARLKQFGLDVRPIEGGIGAASALKMCYGALTKGTQALHGFVLLGAIRSGADAELQRQLAETQPRMLADMARFLPVMFGKAWRWDGEMNEIAVYLSEDPDAAALFQAMARLYTRLGKDNEAGGKGEIAALADFCRRATESGVTPPAGAKG